MVEPGKGPKGQRVDEPVAETIASARYDDRTGRREGDPSGGEGLRRAVGGLGVRHRPTAAGRLWPRPGPFRLPGRGAGHDRRLCDRGDPRRTDRVLAGGGGHRARAPNGPARCSTSCSSAGSSPPSSCRPPGRWPTDPCSTPSVPPLAPRRWSRTSASRPCGRGWRSPRSRQWCSSGCSCSPPRRRGCWTTSIQPAPATSATQSPWSCSCSTSSRWRRSSTRTGRSTPNCSPTWPDSPPRARGSGTPPRFRARRGTPRRRSSLASSPSRTPGLSPQIIPTHCSRCSRMTTT
jgi:hypothetical protein